MPEPGTGQSGSLDDFAKLFAEALSKYGNKGPDKPDWPMYLQNVNHAQQLTRIESDLKHLADKSVSETHIEELKTRIAELESRLTNQRLTVFLTVGALILTVIMQFFSS